MLRTKTGWKMKIFLVYKGQIPNLVSQTEPHWTSQGSYVAIYSAYTDQHSYDWP